MSPPMPRGRKPRGRRGQEMGAAQKPMSERPVVEGSLRIVGLAGLLCTVSVDLASPVAEAQKIIAKTAGVPVREQHLITQDRELWANEVLGDALGDQDEVTLLRCDAKAMAIKRATQTGTLALERARRLTMKGSTLQ
mmetsp:Transcript_53144/g.99629  ORF Transcript_53144/g.99629 Transcript_53144/m.99629 type:complete len:137 (-) Transcript_53144:242-652(-)